MPPYFERHRESDRRREGSTRPEERVRQALARWLREEIKVPRGLMSVEFPLSALDPSCRKRADVVVWIPGGREGLRPWLLAECKAPGIPLDDSVADQIRRYAEKIHAPLVLATNGERTRVFRLGERYEEIEKLPVFGQ